MDVSRFTFGQLSLCLCDYWTFSPSNLDQSPIFKKLYLLYTFWMRTEKLSPNFYKIIICEVTHCIAASISVSLHVHPR